MVTNDISALAEDLERQELEAHNGVVNPQVYEQLLAIYLYENDLCNAKYLWKRIPPSIKSSTPELASIWSVAQHMWRRDFLGVYKSLSSVQWSESVAHIMREVQERVRNRSVDLIGQAYSSITLDTVAAMTGLSSDVCSKACLDKGWQVEADTQIVHPVRPAFEASGHTSSEDQLYKLTGFQLLSIKDLGIFVDRLP